MQLAKPLRRSPRDIAAQLLNALPPSAVVAKAEVAGAGFINLFLTTATKHSIIRPLLTQQAAYGRSTIGKGEKVQVEFVSANPTGPLHVGHGRGAAFGASLANLLGAVGYCVAREYYVNDAGRQMDILTLSTWLRYLALHHLTLSFPGNGYQGEYVREMARMIHTSHGNRFVRSPTAAMQMAPEDVATESHLNRLIADAKTLLGEDYAYLHDFVLTKQLDDCRHDLTEFGIVFDRWFSEKTLHDSGLIARTIAQLASNGHIYQLDGAAWFRASAFGDEKDRVVQRENGQYTYLAADIAYHADKYARGFDRIINVWGADHHGYISRVKGALEALRLDSSKLVITLVQFAVLYRGGVKVPMSTRSGEFVTLRQLRDEVGNDAARFFYVLRKSDQHLDFDLDLAKSQSSDNPVYYIQYAHARICSVLAQWGGVIDDLANTDLMSLTSDYEFALLRRLEEYPDVVDGAARDFSPHLVAYYLKDLAAELHTYYNAEHFLVADETVKLARLALIAAVRPVLANGLALLGVRSPEKM